MADSAQTNGIAWATQSLSNRNGVINGGMDVWQRGTSSASQGYVTADRWYMSGASTTYSQETSDLPTNFRYALKCTMSGTATPSALHAIETQNAIRFANKTVVLSYYVKTSNSTNAVVRLDSSNNVDEAVTGTYSVIAATSVATTTSWTRVSATFAVPSTCKTLRVVVGSNGNLTSGQTILISGIQLEEGSVATPFEFENIGTTLAKCQRYYEKTYNIETNPATATQTGMVGNDITSDVNHNNYHIVRLSYKVTKRAAPTITLYDAAGTAGKAMAFNVAAAGTDGFTVTADVIGQHSFRAYVLGISTAGFIVHYTASAEL
jgi:hypothetical protein